MSCHSVEIEVQAFLADGFEYVRSHPEAIDEIFGKWNADHVIRRIGNTKGQKPTDQIKEWLANTNVPVVLGFVLSQMKVPCISVHLGNSTEAVERSYLGDDGGRETIKSTDRADTLVVDYFVPKSYNPATGKIEINTKTTDISDVREGMILVDDKDEEYLIEVVGDDYILINTEGEPVSKRKLYIKSEHGYTQRKNGIARFNERIDVGFHANEEPQVVLWLYYITAWLFFRFKPVLELRGMQVHTFQASDFNRESQYVEGMYSRWMAFQCDAVLEWNEDKFPINDFGVTVKTSAPDSSSEEPQA